MKRARDASAHRDGSPAARPWVLASWMFVAIALVTGLAWWDEQREANAALQDLETEQTVVAASLAASLRAHLVAVERAGPHPEPGQLARDLLEPDQRIERAGELAVLLAAPDDASLYTTGGVRLDSPPLHDALARGLQAQRLSRPEAAQIGLPARTAMAGLARVEAGPLGRWGVVVVASAARERDREKRALWRLVLGVLVASGLVLAFGGLALRNQRKELDLARELAMARVQRAGDEALARAARIATMGTFAMGIAHEVSTPLGVIVGRSEQLLGRVQGDERAMRGAQIILQQADRIQTIVRRFLDMARGGPPSLERADPALVARKAAASVEHRLAQAGVSLTIDIPSAMPSVSCDRALLEHAIVNLLLNACEACRAGEHVQLGVRSEAERVSFVVTDDGAGITSENAARAKEPFFTTKGQGKGSGLGLAIATEIAHSHLGELRIEPGPGRGTLASIRDPDRGPPRRRLRRQSTPGLNRRSMTGLIKV